MPKRITLPKTSGYSSASSAAAREPFVEHCSLVRPAEPGCTADAASMPIAAFVARSSAKKSRRERAPNPLPLGEGRGEEPTKAMHTFCQSASIIVWAMSARYSKWSAQRTDGGVCRIPLCGPFRWKPQTSDADDDRHARSADCPCEAHRYVRGCATDSSLGAAPRTPAPEQSVAWPRTNPRASTRGVRGAAAYESPEPAPEEYVA